MNFYFLPVEFCITLIHRAAADVSSSHFPAKKKRETTLSIAPKGL